MTSARRLYRVTLGVGALGLMATIAALGISLRGVSLAQPPVRALAQSCDQLLPHELSAAGVAVMAAVLLGLAALIRGVLSGLRLLLGDLRFRRRLRPRGRTSAAGVEVELIEAATPEAFCAGYLRPRIYLSTAALEALEPPQLAAVLAHERHHELRYDPLRIGVARVLADALFFVPAVRRASERYAALAEVAADEASLSSGNSQRALAAALLSFGSPSPATSGAVGIAPERVDHLCGSTPRWGLSARLLAGSLLVAVALVLVALAGVRLLHGSDLRLLVVVRQSCMLLMIGAPLAIAISGLSLVRPRLRRRSLTS